MEEGATSDDSLSPGASAAPAMGWRTPWSQPLVDCQLDQAPPRTTPRSSHFPGSSTALVTQASLQREREHLRQQRRMQHQHQNRRHKLEMLEARSVNRALLQKQRQDMEDMLALQHENEILRAELHEANGSLASLSRDVRRLSAALTKQTALVSNSGGGSKPHRRHSGGKALEQCGDLHVREKQGDNGAFSRTSETNSLSSNSCGGVRSRGGGSGCSSAAEHTFPPSPATPSAVAAPPDAAAAASGSKNIDTHQQPFRDLLDRTRLSLSSSVSGWLEGMLAACSEGLRQALVLPWLLHKLFYLGTELIDERRAELLGAFAGGGPRGMEDEEELAYMKRHLRRHYLTLFPLTGDKLRRAVNTVMMALAHSMIESKEWNADARDPHAVEAALAASGLERVVEEYLRVAVVCHLQEPPVTFTDDLGAIERYNPDRHDEPVDGEPKKQGEQPCVIIIFPAILEGGGAPPLSEVVAGKGEGEAVVVARRLVLNHRQQAGAVGGD